MKWDPSTYESTFCPQGRGRDGDARGGLSYRPPSRLGLGSHLASEQKAPRKTRVEGHYESLQVQIPAPKLLRFDEGFVTEVAFSPDGGTLAAGCGFAPNVAAE